MYRPSRILACAGALWILLVPLPAISATVPPPPLQDPTTSQPDTQEATRTIYLPIVSSAAAGDVKVAAIEVTQAVQTAEMTVPLVAGRPTVARVYLGAAGRTYTNLTVTLSGTRNGTPLAGSPLRTIGMTARASYSRLLRSDSANFLLPASWLSGDVTLTANVAFASGTDAHPGDNVRRMGVSFRSVAPLEITIVPVRYVHLPSGQTYAPPTSFAFLSGVQSMFPVPSLRVRVRSAITFRGDVTFDSGVARIEPWQQLLSLIMALKKSDGAPDRTVYIGVLPGAVIAEHKAYLAGIGSSARSVVGFDIGLILAHEMGHGLGRRHAPCGSPAGVDPSYPYSGASIGVVGYNTARNTIYDPASTTDLMSYCEEWVSDYTYVGMLNDQVAIAGNQAAIAANPVAAPALFVRATLDAQGAVTIAPVYSLDAPLSALPVSSRYQVNYVSAEGQVVSSYPVALVEAEEHGLTARVIDAMLPRPQVSISEVQILADGALVARRPVGTGAASPSVSLEAMTLQVESNSPAIVRRITANSIETLAVDAQGAMEFDTASLAGGPGVLEIVPADVVPGAGAAAISEPLILPDALPDIRINGLSAAPLGEGYVIDGYAYDPEDGTLEIEWAVGGVVTSHGPLLQIETLAGPLTVEAHARDSAGHQATSRLLVSPVAPPPEPPD